MKFAVAIGAEVGSPVYPESWDALTTTVGSGPVRCHCVAHRIESDNGVASWRAASGFSRALVRKHSPNSASLASLPAKLYTPP